MTTLTTTIPKIHFFSVIIIIIIIIIVIAIMITIIMLIIIIIKIIIFTIVLLIVVVPPPTLNFVSLFVPEPSSLPPQPLVIVTFCRTPVIITPTAFVSLKVALVRLLVIMY